MSHTNINFTKTALILALISVSSLSFADSIDEVIAGKATAAQQVTNGAPVIDEAQMFKAQQKQRKEAANALARIAPKLTEFRGIKNGKFRARLLMSDGQNLTVTDTHPSAGKWRVIKVAGAIVTVRFLKDKSTDTELQVDESYAGSSAPLTQDASMTMAVPNNQSGYSVPSVIPLQPR